MQTIDIGNQKGGMGKSATADKMIIQHVQKIYLDKHPQIAYNTKRRK